MDDDELENKLLAATIAEKMVLLGYVSLKNREDVTDEIEAILNDE